VAPVERGLRGREVDLDPPVARVIAALREVQEVRRLEHPLLAVTDEVSQFLVEGLTAPVAGDVVRRVLEGQARDDLAARLVQDGGPTHLPLREKVAAGVELSLHAVIRWADHLGTNEAALEGLTETELAEPAEFVRLLREAAVSALRGERRPERLGIDRAVANAEFDRAWAELGRRVTQRRLGAPDEQYTADALYDNVYHLLEAEPEALVQEDRAGRSRRSSRPMSSLGSARPLVPADRGSVWVPTGLSENALQDCPVVRAEPGGSWLHRRSAAGGGVRT
jgi:hypothetical protein